MTFSNPSLTVSDKTAAPKHKTDQPRKDSCQHAKQESILILDIPKKQSNSSDTTSISSPSLRHPSSPHSAEQKDNDTVATQQTDAKLYSCPKCQQSFSRPHNLKSHLATHSSDRPFQCDQCGAHFRRQHDLKRHQKLHSGERPFVCQVCSRSFARSDALNRHQRVDGDIRCSMAQRHCIIPFNVAPCQQSASTSSSSSSATAKRAHKFPPAALSMTFSFPAHPIITSTIQPIATNNTMPPPPPQNHRNVRLESSQSAFPSSPSPSPSESSSTSSSSTSSSPQPVSPPMPLLPSPSSLSALPLSDNPNLSPLYNIPPSSDTTTSIETHHHSQQQHQQQQQQEPLITVVPPSSSRLYNHQRTLPAPTASSSSPLFPHSMYIPPFTDPVLNRQQDHRRDQNILRLKQEHEQQMERLANQIHDLEVENKVLRSLVLQSNRRQYQSQQLDDAYDEMLSSSISVMDGGPHKKRSRQASLDGFSDNVGAKRDTPFTKKSRFSI